MFTLDQYALFCIIWTFVATIVQMTVPKYAKNNTWKQVILSPTINFIFAPICYVIAMLRWNTDLLLIIIEQKIKEQKKWEEE